MKVVAAITSYRILVEMSTDELQWATTWKGNAYGPRELQELKVGVDVDIKKEFQQAKALLDTFRGIAPALRDSAGRLQRLASEVEIHEPDASLLAPKGGAA